MKKEGNNYVLMLPEIVLNTQCWSAQIAPQQTSSLICDLSFRNDIIVCSSSRPKFETEEDITSFKKEETGFKAHKANRSEKPFVSCVQRGDLLKPTAVASVCASVRSVTFHYDDFWQCVLVLFQQLSTTRRTPTGHQALVIDNPSLNGPFLISFFYQQRKS